jgi:NADPH2:quinone reductase
MRAAVVSELGRPPEVRDLPEPEAGAGEVVVEVLAAALNPLDLSVAAGRFYGGHPPLPYVAGCEAVGRVRGSDVLVWVHGAGLGVQRDGGLAELAVAPESALVPVPDEAEPEVAVAFGVAGLAGWLALASRAPLRGGETVLVLGATGSVGLVAVQAARLLGAGRVVAAGRSERGLAEAKRMGADAVVRLDGDEADDALRDACGDGADVVIDPLWGAPLAAALAACAPGARIVHLGQSAGPEATLPSGLVRGKQLEILGYSNFGLPHDVLAEEYQQLVRRAAAGEVRLALERFPLERIGEAWRRKQEDATVKPVVVP